MGPFRKQRGHDTVVLVGELTPASRMARQVEMMVHTAPPSIALRSQGPNRSTYGFRGNFRG